MSRAREGLLSWAVGEARGVVWKVFREERGIAEEDGVCGVSRVLVGYVFGVWGMF